LAFVRQNENLLTKLQLKTSFLIVPITLLIYHINNKKQRVLNFSISNNFIIFQIHRRKTQKKADFIKKIGGRGFGGRRRHL